MEKITTDVLDVLAKARVEGNKLFLGADTLDRSLYLKVDKTLKLMGGKWTKSVKAHVFADDAEDLVERILLTGEISNEKKEFQFFETPTALAEKMVFLAGIRVGETVLEPSAGRGRIASLIPGCHCIEKNDANRKFLVDSGFKLVGEDFLQHSISYDVIVANPPFSRQQDIDHINHMIDLSPRVIVSVASASVMFRTNKKTLEFRDRIINLGGEFIPLEPKSFQSSGTNVNTCLVVVKW